MPATNTASRPTSVKLPAALKAQLEKDAQSAGLSLHAFMVQTLADSVRRTRLRESFTRDTAAALDDLILVARIRHQRESGYSDGE